MSVEPNRMAEFAKSARDAVADLEEPLKTEAFKIILQKLIGGAAGPDSPGPSAVKEKKLARKKAAPGKKEKSAELPVSTLRLDVEGIKRLKAYCEGFDLTGTEQVAFILANFAREHTDLNSVTASDIAYLHRMLISARVKVIAINDPADWTRALGWLTNPSRRKEWLEKQGQGFVVSNSGLLRWHEMEAQREQSRSQGT